jgi:hypothetical protein
MQILNDARLADMFVPYHNGEDRYFDLSLGFGLINATQSDAGACGQIIDGKIVEQLSNSELAWKNDLLVRYREELVIWATVGAANYNYIIRYGFRDDGTITLRVGSTSQNLSYVANAGHMHAGLWRIDMDLNGPLGDSVYWMRHFEAPMADPNCSGAMSIDPSTGMPLTPDPLSCYQASDTHTDPFNGGVEGSAIWKAEEFNHVLLQDQTLNDANPPKPISYEFMPVRMGRAVHNELFARADFWVTAAKDLETKYHELPAYAADAEPIVNTDVVVWHLSPMHHDPRDEDGFDSSPPNTFWGNWIGVALVMWSGLDIRPRNLWSRTPLYAGCESTPAGMKSWFKYDASYADTVAGVTGVPSGSVQASDNLPLNHVGQAVSLGASGRIDFPPAAAFGIGTSDFSVDTWVKIPQSAQNALLPLLDTRTTSSPLRGIAVFTYLGRIGLQMADGVGTGWSNFVPSDTAAAIADGKWHHIAITVKRGDPQGIKFYVDGLALSSTFDPSVRAGSLGTAQGMTIGHDLHLDRAGGTFAIDNVEFFHRILDDTEILRVAQNPKCLPKN